MQPLSAIVVPSLAALLERYRDLSTAVAAEPSPDAVHDLRVAVRRLRGALRLLRPVTEPPRIRTASLRRLEGQLGRVRDEDIVIAWLGPESLSGLGLPPDEHLARVGRKATRRRSQAAEQLTRALGRAKLLRTLQDAQHWVESPRLGAMADAPAHAVVPDLVSPHLALVSLHRGWHLPWPPAFDPGTSRVLHQLRRRLKRLRYAVEFLDPVWGDAARQLLHEWHAVSDGLGTWHDLDLAAGWVARGPGHLGATEALARRAALALMDWPRWRGSWTDPARLALVRAAVLMPGEA